MAIESQPKWEAKVRKKLNKHKAEEVWPFLEDFCSFNKWLPSIDTCYKVEGVQGRPGLVRYCAATLPPPPPDGAGGGETIKWCHEKLLAIDPIKKCLSYEVLDNNMGFQSYKSTMEVLPSMESGDDQKGCLIEWSFLADPIEGLRFEDMVAYLDSSLQGMIENIERALENK
ncbi:Polyketide cyclase/dehydrase and lipid transport superfamily protein [Forsythia ovata]|uniref:Polyketide cyclase/dehydrase and lipid transport superfamily protein n=1 Tax=Forsythia ovata TaxID=205694 RepID=A0ABD1W592_9LAMI